jgi:hypothetical protein
MSVEKKTAPALFAGAVVDNGSKAIDAINGGGGRGNRQNKGERAPSDPSKIQMTRMISHDSAMKLEATHRSTGEKREIYCIRESAQL